MLTFDSVKIRFDYNFMLKSRLKWVRTLSGSAMKQMPVLQRSRWDCSDSTHGITNMTSTSSLLGQTFVAVHFWHRGLFFCRLSIRHTKIFDIMDKSWKRDTKLSHWIEIDSGNEVITSCSLPCFAITSISALNRSRAIIHLMCLLMDVVTWHACSKLWNGILWYHTNAMKAFMQLDVGIDINRLTIPESGINRLTIPESGRNLHIKLQHFNDFLYVIKTILPIWPVVENRFTSCSVVRSGIGKTDSNIFI